MILCHVERHNKTFTGNCSYRGNIVNSFPILGQINLDANVPPSLDGSYSIAGTELSNLFLLYLIVILDLPSDLAFRDFP